MESMDWIWYVGPILLILLTAWIGWRRRSSTQRQLQDIHDVPNVPEKGSLLVKKNTKPNSRIKIVSRGVRNQETDSKVFMEIIDQLQPVQLNLNQIWKDTAISNISLSTYFCESLTSYLLQFAIDDERNICKVDVEIGGFLLGRYSFLKDKDTYQVLVEKFIPIESEHNHKLQLEFSTSSLSIELGNAQDEYPNLSVLGWFHTHPGHGVFLSKPDLAIQRGFFTEKFQFAMEIDSLSSELDLGFFTYKKNGNINNTLNTQEKPNWFSWLDVANLR